MSYDVSPMSEFNKSNPLVMLCKKEYINIMDTLQSCSKSFVERVIALGVTMLVSIGLLILAIVTGVRWLLYASIIWICVGLIFDLLYYLYYRRSVYYYMRQHRGMIEFDRISDMELNEILRIGHEELLVCLHGIYELKGGLDVTVTNIKVIGVFLVALEFCGTIGTLAFWLIS